MIVFEAKKKKKAKSKKQKKGFQGAYRFVFYANPLRNAFRSFQQLPEALVDGLEDGKGLRVGPLSLLSLLFEILVNDSKAVQHLFLEVGVVHDSMVVAGGKEGGVKGSFCSFCSFFLPSLLCLLF